jgi:hypothetical protein
MRECRKCNKVQDDSQFGNFKHPNGKVYTSYRCKTCANTSSRESNWARVGIKNASLASYREKLIEQNYQCAICSVALVENKNTYNAAHLDHNHETGLTRGVLCNNCNAGLGMFKDDVVKMAKAISYLNSYA